jgi:hypothetical protein
VTSPLRINTRADNDLKIVVGPRNEKYGPIGLLADNASRPEPLTVLLKRDVLNFVLWDIFPLLFLILICSFG